MEKSAVVLGIWTFLLVMLLEVSKMVTTKNVKSFLFCVKDKFTRALQSFVVPDFTFLFIQIVHYFSCAIRNSPFPATRIK
jgi:hypothetical protein